MEDKKKICEMLSPVLQEIVTATFCSGYQKAALKSVSKGGVHNERV